jgi:ferritin-like metal-binding protein YciE
MVADTAHSLFITGLRNARALENEALSLMQRQIDRLEHYPQVLARLKDHHAETEGQIQRLDSIFSALDESPSTLKDTALSFMGNMAALAHTVAPDEILKNSIANFAFENFEIASYKSLITMAEASGFANHAASLRQTLGEEQAMAKWLDDNIRTVTTQFMELESRGQTAKV